jgi:hypothetical protein
MSRYLTRDRLAVLAALAAPLVLAAILVPFQAGFPNTAAALAMLVVVAANGYRLAGFLAAVSVAMCSTSSSPSRTSGLPSRAGRTSR